MRILGKKFSTVALFLASIMVATIITSAPVGLGQIPPPILSWSYCDAIPDTIGLGQWIYIVGWVNPPPPHFFEIYYNYTFTVTDPDGVTYTHKTDSDSPGTASFGHQCNKLGEWSATLYWPGDSYKENVTRGHNECQSDPAYWTVQQDPVEPYGYEDVPLPTGPWDYPISSEAYEWYQISGAWMFTGSRMGYNGTGGNFNPYTWAPKAPHILWKKQTGTGGLIGGDEGYLGNQRGSEISAVAWQGRLYYATRTDVEGESRAAIVCLDQFTGEEIFTRVLTAPGVGVSNLALELSGTIKGDPGRGEGETGVTSLWAIGDALWELDPFDGTEKYYLYGPFRHGAVYADHNLYMTYWKSGNLTKWSCRDKEIVWTVPVHPRVMTAYGGVTVYDDIVMTVMYLGGNNQDPYGWKLTTLNATTGEIIADPPHLELSSSQTPGIAGYGRVYWHLIDRRVHAFDLVTGAEVWKSEQMEAPWGVYAAYTATCGYGMAYFGSWDGYLYAYDCDDGSTEWRCYSADTTDTAMGHYSWWGRAVLGGGVIFAATGQHTPPNPLPRGNKLRAVDAYSGDLLWEVPMMCGTGGISSGILWYTNNYDGCVYAFGKGPSGTTVSVSDGVIANGDSVLISGTVTDQTPGMEGTPAISDEDMGKWMEYMYMGRPVPDIATGVPVLLQAMCSDYSVIDIAWVTSDMMGNFEYLWTPPAEDTYKILASFLGSESYYMSSDGTALAVTAAPEEPTTEPTEEPAFTTIDLAIIAAVIVAIIIGIVNLWALRKRA
jgi:outer membrane protein assembly factor BamB